MRVALVHDWLIHMRGGEKVLECLAQLYPDATIYTLFYDRKTLSPTLKKMRIRASFLQHWPGIKKFYRWLLPILPHAIESLKVKDADLVISSSHCVAKGVRIPEKAFHICYCHTPMRYLWSFYDEYFGKFPSGVKPFMRKVFERLRRWDLESNESVDRFIAISKYIQARIQRVYGRDSEVIYPPVDIHFYHPQGEPQDYYLVTSAFVPYKRVDLVIQAFNGLDRRLMIVGSGPLEHSYRAQCQGSNITFLGACSNEELRTLYAQAKALIFPTEEDFGIVPVEAQACGTPVIALKKGGALEGVKTGVFFEEQTPMSLQDAIAKFEKMNFDRKEIPTHVAGFSRSRFCDEIKEFVSRAPSPALAHA